MEAQQYPFLSIENNSYQHKLWWYKRQITMRIIHEMFNYYSLITKVHTCIGLNDTQAGAILQKKKVYWEIKILAHMCMVANFYTLTQRSLSYFVAVRRLRAFIYVLWCGRKNQNIFPIQEFCYQMVEQCKYRHSIFLRCNDPFSHSKNHRSAY